MSRFLPTAGNSADLWSRGWQYCRFSVEKIFPGNSGELHSRYCRRRPWRTVAGIVGSCRIRRRRLGYWQHNRKCSERGSRRRRSHGNHRPHQNCPGREIGPRINGAASERCPARCRSPGQSERPCGSATLCYRWPGLPMQRSGHAGRRSLQPP